MDEAVAALVEGREWVEAGRVARKSKRADLLPTTVITALSEAHVAMAHEVQAPLHTPPVHCRALQPDPKP